MLVEVVGKVWHCSAALRWFWNVVLSFVISLISSERGQINGMSLSSMRSRANDDSSGGGGGF